MSMKPEVELGKVIGAGDFDQRDAIHVAVVPVMAGHYLEPGTHVGLVKGLANVAADENHKGLIGIIDPFLKRGVNKGERCWMLLYPNTVTSMRHVWSHPGVVDEKSGTADSQLTPLQASSKLWLENYAQSLGLTYEDLMGGAQDFVSSGDYLCRGGLLEGVSVDDEFWPHYQVVTDTLVPRHKTTDFFTCSG